ncbi:MAG: hypothetical protein KM296_00160 [Brockia lithotrophica]|nr:hypothetical protein [Brockia lithotrophica]
MMSKPFRDKFKEVWYEFFQKPAPPEKIYLAKAFPEIDDIFDHEIPEGYEVNRDGIFLKKKRKNSKKEELDLITSTPVFIGGILRKEIKSPEGTNVNLFYRIVYKRIEDVINRNYEVWHRSYVDWDILTSTKSLMKLRNYGVDINYQNAKSLLDFLVRYERVNKDRFELIAKVEEKKDLSYEALAALANYVLENPHRIFTKKSQKEPSEGWLAWAKEDALVFDPKYLRSLLKELGFNVEDVLKTWKNERVIKSGKGNRITKTGRVYVQGKSIVKSVIAIPYNKLFPNQNNFNLEL